MIFRPFFQFLECPKIMIFCGNFFASRAVAELLNNWNAGRVLENWSEYSEQLLESRLLGPAQQDEKWLANRFKVRIGLGSPQVRA